MRTSFGPSGDWIRGTHFRQELGISIVRDKAFATFGQKMPKRCVVGGCSNTANQEEGISVHEIPFWGEESPVLAKRRGKWEKFVKSTRQKWTATRGTVVCSKHFTEDCFEYGSDTVEKYKTPRLKKDNLGVCVFPTLATSAETSVESKRTRRAK